MLLDGDENVKLSVECLKCIESKLQNAPEKPEAFCVVGNLKKERFVLRGETLRFIFSERFVLRIIHILKRVPRRKAKHQGNGDNIPTRLYNFNNLIISILATHIEIGFSGAVK